MQGLQHCGLSGSGMHSDGDQHIGAQYVSVLNSARREQPVCNEKGDKAIVFDGKIYNCRSLQAQLRDKGHVFVFHNDAEVVLHLYEEYGVHCVDHLRGIFAFAISDGRRLFLARDRVGFKPLYYTILRQRLFLFASEIKAILQWPDVPVSFDMQTFTDNLALNFPVGRRTFFENVQSVLPGSTMMISNSEGVIEINERQYYRVTVCPDDTWTLRGALDTLKRMLDEAVESHIAGEAEVGISLSGGLDSSLLALVMKQYCPAGLTTFTVADNQSHPDLFHARRLSAELEARHQVIDFTFDAYLREIPACLAIEEQPSILTFMPFRFLCQRASRVVKSCLSGEGADTVFGGLEEFMDRSTAIRAVGKRLEAVKQWGLKPSLECAAIIDAILADSEPAVHLINLFEINLKDPATRINLELLAKHSMAAGLELRLPYYDDALVEFVNSLPLRFKADVARGIPKYILKRLAIEKHGTQLFDIVLRRKLGFPMATSLFLRRLNRICVETVAPDYARRHEFGRFFPHPLPLVLFDMFHEIFITHRGFPPVEMDIMEFMRAAN